MNGMAPHGGVLPVGGTFFVLLRLHASRGPPGRAQRGPRHLLVDPRLHRPRRGRPDAPADRAPGLAAGHAGPEPRAPGRRQRDGAGLAARRRGGRPGRPGPHPPGRARAGRDRRTGGRGRARAAPTSWPTATGTPEIVLVGTGSEVQHCLAAAATLAGSGVPARVVSFPCWDRFEQQDRGLPGERLPAGRARAEHRGRARPSAGTATPTTPSGSTTSARRPRWPSSWRSSASRADHVVERARGPALARAGVADRGTTRRRELSR